MVNLAKEIPCLPPALLAQIAGALCRVKYRAAWWAGSKSGHYLGAVGLMLKDAIHIRNRGCRAHSSQSDSATKCPELTQTDLWLALPHERPSKPAFNAFLNGAPPKKSKGRIDYYSVARKALRTMLLGSGESVSRECEAQFEIVKQYFFNQENVLVPDVNSERSYFDPAYKRSDFPVRSAEAIAEVRSLACDARNGQDCRLLRVSGALRFPHLVSEESLSASGEATVECLEAGVRVVIAFSKLLEGAPAARSALTFERYVRAYRPSAAKNLKLIPLDPAKVVSDRWAGEYLSRTFRWALYERLDKDADPPILIVARSPNNGPIAFQPDADEISQFRGWANALIWNAHSIEDGAAR